MTEEEFGELLNEVGGDSGDQWKHTFKIVNAAIAKNREACARLVDDEARDYRGASVQVAFPENARAQLAEIAEILKKQAQRIREGKIDFLRRPLRMLLWCPVCHTQHVDRHLWATEEKAHKKHLCEKCGHLWQPANVYTVGVEQLPA